MTAGQRRTLWLCVVGLTYIFWYEASGVALFWKENAPGRRWSAWTPGTTSGNSSRTASSFCSWAHS